MNGDATDRPPDEPLRHPSVLNPVAAYVVFGALWILLSDQFVALIIPGGSALHLANILKDWTFVLVTSALLYGILRHQARKIAAMARRESQAMADKARSQRLLSEILDNSADAIFAKDAQGRYLLFNQEACRVTGQRVIDVIGRDDSALFPPREAAVVRDNDRRVMEQDHIQTYEERLSTVDGEVTYLAVKGPLHDAQGNVSGMFGISRDITARKRAEEELRIASMAFESREGIMVTDANGVIVRVNQAFTRLTGFSPAEAVGQKPAMLRSGRNDKAFYERMWQSIIETGYWQGEVWNRRKDGELYAEWLTISTVRGADGAVTHYIGAFSDITKDKEAQAAIHRLAYYDSLTNLPNRRLLYDRIEQAIAGSNRSNAYGALLFMDIDHFKNLNDTRGHDVGDQLLIETAERLKSVLREGDTVARLGGDEFVVMLKELSDDPSDAAILARSVAEHLRLELAKPYCLSGPDFHCSVSLGVKLFRNREESVDTVLKHADLAMYQAKAAGRDAIRFFDPLMQTNLDKRAALESDLHTALKEGQFEVHYQPQCNGTRRTIGAEALLRWRHPEKGMVSPADFIPLAEDTGLILPIGQWVLETVCAQIADWSSSPDLRDLLVAVNVSARQFRQRNFVAQVKEALSRSGANPRQLKIELTESMVVQDMEDTFKKMQDLKSTGVGFSLDDFGTGYSSLAYLSKLPLDQLKIDRSFVVNLPVSRNDMIIAQTVIAMAKGLGLAVIAEGVETEAQRRFLEAHCCDAYQGYLFSRPVPTAAFEDYVAHGRQAILSA